MNRYRIGFDMTVLWAIYERDCVTPYNLSDKEVRMFITHDRGREPVEVTKTQLPDGTVNNVIRWFWPGVKQRILGPYTLTLEILTSADKRVIRKDVCDAFILVGRDCLATEDEGEANINEGGEITLASSLDIYRISPIIPQIGENGNWFVDGVDTGRPAKGEDAYQIAVSRGYDGTYEEYAMLCANIGRAVVSQDVSEILIMRESEYDPDADYGNALIGLKEG